VNGLAFTPERLRAATGESKDKPVELLIRLGDTLKTIKLDYTGGHRYPRLERISGKPAYIDDILAAR
jgi:hypothetical protein